MTGEPAADPHAPEGCPWCGHTDRRGYLCVGCQRPWELWRWQPQWVASADPEIKAKIALALVASIATSELEEMAVQAVQKDKAGVGRPIPVSLSVGWILKARALL